MDVEKVFHMTAGVGETSYARNSSLQKKVSDMMKHITLETVQELYATKTPRSFGIADLGCSSGHNSLFIIRKMIDAIEEASQKALQPVPEFRVHLNDLPTNDFNTIFIKALPVFHREVMESRTDGSSPSIYVGANPGTFYGRLFPSESLHFIYSSYCLHWLSRVPPALHDEQGGSINKGNIYISETSPPEVSEAYFKQFQEDFSLFLRSRSEELINGGRMVLILLGRIGTNQVDRGNSFLWELLSRTFAILVSKGEIEEEKLNYYNVHFYAPSKDELEDEVRREGSFILDRFEMFETGKDFVGGGINYGKAVAKTARATQESSILHLFGEGIDLNCLFENYAELVDEENAKEEIVPVSFLLVLRKIK